VNPVAIRALAPVADRHAVAALLIQAQDYYHLWLGHPPGEAEVTEALTATPPGCDPAQSHRLGLYLGDRLCGIAELSFGFPVPNAAYLGLMILAPGARSVGHGAAFHAHILALARAKNCAQIFLAVLNANPRGRAFWQRLGYVETGVTRQDAETGHLLHRLVRPL
jgi:GNAT superfamily N-acetyltransferase